MQQARRAASNPMRLQANTPLPRVKLLDKEGAPIALGFGRPTLLSFFRDTNCPFCNARLFMLTHRYKDYAAAGLQVVAFFSASHEQVEEFLRIRPRPFPVIADPKMRAYRAYGIQRSLARKVKGVARRPSLWMRGMRLLGLKRTVKSMGGLRTSNIMPADILVDENGRVVEAYYGQDAGDHIPFERIEQFIGIQAS